MRSEGRVSCTDTTPAPHLMFCGLHQARHPCRRSAQWCIYIDKAPSSRYFHKGDSEESVLISVLLITRIPAFVGRICSLPSHARVSQNFSLLEEVEVPPPLEDSVLMGMAKWLEYINSLGPVRNCQSGWMEGELNNCSPTVEYC